MVVFYGCPQCGHKKLNKLDNNKNFQFKKGNRDRKDISYLKIKKVHKQEGFIGLLKVKKSMETRIDCGPLF